MLRDHLSRRAWDALERTARGRRAALKARGAAALWAKGVRRAVAEALDLGDLAARPLKIRRVSRFEQPHLTVENVLFESLDGWSVNGSVFVPRDPLYAPPYPAVVVPCGHSTKTGPNYQGVCQVLARAGWIAITFDPPGQGTEKDPGNDHFRDAPRGYAVGWNAQRFFVADALRAIDYLSTRPDVDRRPGFALTGVSGGGHTTMWAALMDRRIRLAAPVCCATRLSAHPVRDGYAGCAEGFSIGRCRAGLDDVDLMAALAPIPQLFMAGARDEVMTAAMSRELADDVARAYGVAGVPEAFEFRLMPGGHEYTPAMARYFVEFAERRWLGRPGGRRIAAFEEDPALIPAEQLLCRPAPEPNMRTLCAARAAALRRSRPPIDSNAAARRAVARVVPGLRSARFEAVRRGDRQIAWCSKVEELLFRHETDIFLPATALWPLRPKPWPALVMFDDTGRWSALRQSGWLAAVSRFLDRETDWAPAVVSVDLRGRATAGWRRRPTIWPVGRVRIARRSIWRRVWTMGFWGSGFATGWPRSGG